MIVKINGQETRFDREITVSELVKIQNLEGKMIVIEKNLDIIQKHAYPITLIKDGDNIEIVSLCGGG